MFNVMENDLNAPDGLRRLLWLAWRIDISVRDVEYSYRMPIANSNADDGGNPGQDGISALLYMADAGMLKKEVG